MNEFLKPEEYKELDELMTYILGEMLETKDKVFIREGIIAYTNRWHEMQVNAAEQRTSKCNKHIVNGSALLKDLLSSQQEIISSPIRFNGVSNEDIKRIFAEHGIKYEQPF